MYSIDAFLALDFGAGEIVQDYEFGHEYENAEFKVSSLLSETNIELDNNTFDEIVDFVETNNLVGIWKDDDYFKNQIISSDKDYYWANSSTRHFRRNPDFEIIKIKNLVIEYR